MPVFDDGETLFGTLTPNPVESERTVACPVYLSYDRDGSVVSFEIELPGPTAPAFHPADVYGESL